MFRAGSRDAARHDLAAFRNILLETVDVAVADVDRFVRAKVTRLALRAAVFDRALRFGSQFSCPYKARWLAAVQNASSVPTTLAK